MQISLILAHPNPTSFNHAIAAAARCALERCGHQVHFHDLCAEGFDPLLTPPELASGGSGGDDDDGDDNTPPLIDDPALACHCQQIADAEGIVIVHPNWWGQPPAILKGWIDRVLRQNVAYRFDEGDNGEGVPVGLLKAETAVVFTTSNTPLERELQVFGDPLETLWKNCILAFCGIKNVIRKNFSVIVVSTPDQRAAWLRTVARTVADAFPTPTPRTSRSG